MRKAVFLDRDGTLNPDPGYISNPDDYELFPGVALALAQLKKAGYLLILVTNQSGISRGLISCEQLETVHEKMQNLLAAAGATLDAIYFCPHHPDFPPINGVSDCNCRKPRPGMVLQAISDFAIDRDKSYLIGDRTNDIQAAVNAKIQPVCISLQPAPGYDDVPTFATLKEAVNWILAATAR